MNMQPCDVLDRLTIVMLHILHGNDEVADEYTELVKEAMRLDPVIGEFIRLFAYNRAIWRLESDLRRGKDGDLSKDEIADRAIKIRDHNKERVAAKDRVAKLLGGFSQKKVDHASA